MNLLSILEKRDFDSYKKLLVFLATSRKTGFGTWKFMDWQVRDIYTVISGTFDEIMILRNRAGSKTRDMVNCLVFLAYQINKNGEYNRCIWFSGSLTQLQIVKRYLRQHRYVKEVTIDEIRFFNGNIAYLRIMTVKQSVSSRADYIFFDEEQGYDNEIYRMALGIILEGSGKLVHIGTTELNTVFEMNYRKLMKENAVLEHTIDDCVWIDKQKAMKIYEGLPDWVIQSQLYCKWVAPGGNVFEKVYIEDLNSLRKNSGWYGVDPNPSSGHFVVGVDYIEYKGKEVIYVFSVESFKDPMDLISYLMVLKGQGCTIEVEQQFGLDLMKLYKNEVNRRFGNKSFDFEYFISTVVWTEKSKLSRVRLIREKEIYIHPRYKSLFNSLVGVEWDKGSLDPKIYKTPNMHDVDAFMHACCKNKLITPTLIPFDEYYERDELQDDILI